MNNTTPHEELQESSNEKYGWIHKIFSIPKIGGLLVELIAIAPLVPISLVFMAIAPKDDSVPGWPVIIITIILLSLMLIVWWWWLHYLERKINLAICLPIPIIKIKVRWLLYPLMLPFFGIKKMFSSSSNKNENKD